MKKHYNLNVTEDNGESVTTSNTSTEHASEILRIMSLAGIKPEAIEEHGEAEMQHTPANDELDLDDYSKKSPESIAKQKKSIQPSHGDNPLEYSLDENEIFESLMADFKSEMLEEGACPECGGKKHKLMACSSCGCNENLEEKESSWKTPEGGPLSYKRIGEYTYIVKDENGKEHKAEMGAMGDEQDNYSGDEVEQTMDQEGLEMLIRQAKMGAPTHGDFKSPEGGPLSYKRVGEYTYIVKDENGKEHKAEAGATDDTQDNYSGDEVEQTMDQDGLEMLIRQAKMGAPVKEAEPMGDYTDKEFACININTGEYGYCDKDELHKYTHYVPAEEFTYFDDENEDMDFADFDDEMADQEGWMKIPSNEVSEELSYMKKLAGL